MATTAASLTKATLAAAQLAGGSSEAAEHQVCELLMQLYRQKMYASGQLSNRFAEFVQHHHTAPSRHLCIKFLIS